MRLLRSSIDVPKHLSAAAVIIHVNWMSIAKTVMVELKMRSDQTLRDHPQGF